MQVAIVGAGIVGATIAYVLSEFCEVVVYDRALGPTVLQSGAMTSATGAALGLLMAAVSTKAKGRNLRMRLAGVDWYDRAIPELETLTGERILYNRQGLLMVQYEAEKLVQWGTLIGIREAQGRRLDLWSTERLGQTFPQVCLDNVVGALYSPDDRQVDAAALTRALIEGSKRRGVRFEWEQVVTDLAQVAGDRLVVCAGVGSGKLVGEIGLRSVLGQAMRVRLGLGNVGFQPVLSGHDIHFVPLGNGEYWVGATVEFDPHDGVPEPDEAMFEAFWEQAVGMVPGLGTAEVLMRWHGWRGRPVGRSAPVIEDLGRVIFASGHYRNGVLLAPGTAFAVREMLGFG